MQRVVVTGLAAITPIGNNLQESWSNLLKGVSGIGPISRFDCGEYETKIAAEVKNFDPKQFLEPKQVKKLDRFCHYAIAATKMLLEDARLNIDSELEENLGVIVGCGLGGLETIEDFHTKLLKKGPRKISPFSIPKLIANMAAGQISISIRAKGPNLVTTSACASGLHAVGYAYSEIKLGRVQAMITGGVESTITPMAVSGFNAMKALSTRNDEPQKASRPFDKDRDGFIIGEGCGLLLLESLESALNRGAKIYAEVVGFGASSDAYHMTAPIEDGSGMELAMRKAIQEAGVSPSDIDHINAHGTSTKLNDLCETRAIKKLFGPHAYDILITANKSMIGHTLGAAGGIESVFSVLSLYEGKIPGTLNLDNPDEECDLNYCPYHSVSKEIHFALCNSFGFGGTNGSILFKKFTS
ncbi:MAG: beta-ketoacyl-ACP synthase II [Desulfonauticus sp.]|nr:beta-ketoacyl-ACP synthase II [Desulfonauticus sp.]